MQLLSSGFPLSSALSGSEFRKGASKLYSDVNRLRSVHLCVDAVPLLGSSITQLRSTVSCLSSTIKRLHNSCHLVFGLWTGHH